MKLDRMLSIITILLQKDKVTAPELAEKQVSGGPSIGHRCHLPEIREKAKKMMDRYEHDK